MMIFENQSLPYVSELTKARFKKFKSVKRAYYSFLILTSLFIISLFSEFIANDQPVIVHYQNEFYAPVFFFYSDRTFGGSYDTAADYLKLKDEPQFQLKGNWMLFPILSHGPSRTYIDLAGAPPHPPSLVHLLGTDSSARDVLSRLIYGFRTSMIFSLTLTVIGILFGVIIGGVQGYFGGRFDILLQRFIEIWSALPFLYIVILLGSVYGQSFTLLIVVMSLFEWIALSYYMRGEFFKLRNMNFVVISRSLGVGHVRIFFQEILPNAVTPVITIAPFMLIGGISSLTALDFLGFGLPPPTPSWGELLRQGLKNLFAPWISLSSSIALFTTLLLATFIGEGIREAFDPRSGQRWQ